MHCLFYIVKEIVEGKERFHVSAFWTNPAPTLERWDIGIFESENAALIALATAFFVAVNAGVEVEIVTENPEKAKRWLRPFFTDYPHLFACRNAAFIKARGAK